MPWGKAAEVRGTEGVWGSAVGRVVPFDSAPGAVVDLAQVLVVLQNVAPGAEGELVTLSRASVRSAEGKGKLPVHRSLASDDSGNAILPCGGGNRG